MRVVRATVEDAELEQRGRAETAAARATGADVTDPPELTETFWIERA